MVVGTKHIYQVKQHFYFRIKVPKHIRSKCRTSQIKKSLYTDNLQIAHMRVTILRQLVLLLFKQIEEDMISEEELIKTINDQTESIRTNGVTFGFVKNTANNQPDGTLPEIPPAGVQLPYLYAIRNKSTDSNVNDKLDMLISMVERREHIQAQESNPKTINIPLDKLIEAFLEENSSSGRWNPKTVMDTTACINFFGDYFKKKSLEQIQRKDIVDFRNNVLCKLPKNRMKNKRLRKMSLSKQLEDTKVDKISVKRINTHLWSVSAFYNWCVDRGYVPRSLASDLNLRDSVSPEDKRLAYNKLELEKIVVNLSQLPDTPVNKIKNIDRIWIILIAMYHGVRENEICQLQIDNIVAIDNIPCILITKERNSRQSIKNKSSFRKFPIHETLLQLDFLEFVNSRRIERNKIVRRRKISSEIKVKQRQLFPTMTCAKSHDNYAKNFYNFYKDFNKNITNNPKRSFHSLRHNFISALNNGTKVPHAVSYLVGHAFKTETSRNYTDPDFKILQKELSKLDYGFDIFKIFGNKALTKKAIAGQVKQLPVVEK